MFETINNSEIPLPKELAPNGERLWSYIHLQLHKVWFYAEVEHVADDFKCQSMYILSSLAQLQKLAIDPALNLTAVHVSTPKNLNNDDCWKMFRLKRILRGDRRNSRGKLWTTIYEVYGEGKVIYDPPLSATDQLKNIEVVLDF